MSSFLPRLQAALRRIASWGLTETDTDSQRARKGIVTVTATLVGLVFIAAIGPFYLAFNEPLVSLAYISVGLFMVLGLAFVKPVWGSYDRFLLVLSVLVLPTHLLVHVLLGGFIESGGILLWGLAHPVMSNLVLYGPRSALKWLPAFFLNLLIAVSLTPLLTPTPNLPQPVMLGGFVLSVSFISLIITLLMTYFVGQLESAYALLRGEQEKSESLLLNILPSEIASILKNENRLIADYFEGASVLFADVVNFTPMSAKMSPTELVNLLNELFSHFDSLVERYGLEKIKTIGDCYMVASGLPRPRPDHAQALSRLALDMQFYVNHNDLHGQRLALRIGINSGPVVAGVIGRKKFIYDLWGDAVNTASRMESHGESGIIQITQATYDLIQHEFNCQPRGQIYIKGKGEMTTWQVIDIA